MRRRVHSGGERGQSEVVGIVLLIAVVTTLVIGAGAVVIGDWQSQTDRETQVNVQSELTAADLSLKHLGGDGMAPEDVLVVLVGADTNLTLDEFTDSNGNTRFESGSTWEHEIASVLDGAITLRVFQTETNTLIHEERYEVGQDGLVLEVDGEAAETTIENGKTVPYTVTRTFERAPPENVSTKATVTEVVGNNVSIDQGALTVTGDAEGVSTVEATLDGMTATIEVEVVNRPDLRITNVDSPGTVDRGDGVTVEGTIENTGTANATDATIELTIVDDAGDTTFTDTATIDLDTGNSQTVTFNEWTTDSGDVGDHTVTVSSTDDTRDTSLTVVKPNPSDLLNITEGGTAIGEGESFDQHLTYENVHNETVTLVTEGDGTEPTRTTIEIDPGETVTPETLGFPESGVLKLVTDNANENKVTVEIDEQ
jgi:hypothetical protein